jgi:hypothetical protein
MDLFDINEFGISASQCPTHYFLAGIGNVLDIVVHQNTRMSDVIVPDILGSDHLPIVFHILYHVIIMTLSEHTEKFTDLDRFQTSPLN